MIALRRALIATSIAWAALLPLVPWLASWPHATSGGAALILAVYAVGSAICHQLPERSYHLWTAQMPVCARCLGIYVGAAVVAMLAGALPLKRRPLYETFVGHVDEKFVGHRFSGAEIARATLIVAALPTALTLVYEWTTGHTPANSIRAAAGLSIGAVAAWLIVSLLSADNQVN